MLPAPFRAAIKDAIRAAPFEATAALARRLGCNRSTVWRYRSRMWLPVRKQPQADVRPYHHFTCLCGAPVVVGPISARGARKCSMCRAERCA